QCFNFSLPSAFSFLPSPFAFPSPAPCLNSPLVTRHLSPIYFPVLTIDAQEEAWPLDKPFRISRGTRTEARVVVVTVTNGQHTGRGEAVPIRRYNQTPASVLAEIESIKSAPDLNRQQLQKLLPPGAARNAVD